MTVSELLATLNSMQSGKEILAQVVDQNGRAWNMFLQVNNIENSNMVQVALSHPQLVDLPIMDAEQL